MVTAAVIAEPNIRPRDKRFRPPACPDDITKDIPLYPSFDTAFSVRALSRFLPVVAGAMSLFAPAAACQMIHRYGMEVDEK
jgi:hypothetical protein